MQSPFDGGQLMVVTVVSRFITLSSRGIIEATRSIYLSSSNVEALRCVSQKISKIGPNECLLFGA